MNASPMRKKRKPYPSPTGEETGTVTLPGILLRSCGIFFCATALLSLLVTVLAYLQTDPSRFLFLGTACPYLAALPAGLVAAKTAVDKPLLYAVLCGGASAVLLWLLSAGLPLEGTVNAVKALLKYVAVILCFAAGGLLGRIKPAANPRRHRPRKY